MGADDTSINEALKNMKDAFTKLSGTGSPSDGFVKLNELDNAFSAGGIDDLEPKIRTAKLIELLSPDYNYSLKVKDKDGNTIT